MILSDNVETFRTPNGNSVQMYFREPTSDRSVIEAIMTNNEYQIPTHYTGIGIDVGAHVGAWTVAALADNPGLAVVAIEAVYENVLMMRRNIALNDMQKRAKVLHRAAHSGNYPVKIAYAFRGEEFQEYNRFIGNLAQPGIEHEVQEVQGLRLTRLARFVKEPIRIMKIDCEGCEWSFLKGDGLKRIAEIVGEFHGGAERITEQLSPTHVVEVLSDQDGFGNFRAVLR